MTPAGTAYTLDRWKHRRLRQRLWNPTPTMTAASTTFAIIITAAQRMCGLTNQGNRRAGTAACQVEGLNRRVRVDRAVRPHSMDMTATQNEAHDARR